MKTLLKCRRCGRFASPLEVSLRTFNTNQCADCPTKEFQGWDVRVEDAPTKTLIYWHDDRGDLYLAEHLDEVPTDGSTGFVRYEIEHPVTLTLEQMVLGKNGNDMLDVLLQIGKAREVPW